MLLPSAPASQGCVPRGCLSDFYDRVSVFERDELPDHAANRPAVPQGRHVHLLMARGAQEFETLFPAIGDLVLHNAPGPRRWWYHPVGGLFDQFLGAAESDPVLAEWFLRRFKLLDSLYMVPSARLVGRTIRHNLAMWLRDRRSVGV